MNKRNRRELKKLELMLQEAKPGTPVYDRLLEEYDALSKTLLKKQVVDKSIGGFSKDALLGAGVAVTQLAILVTWQDKKFLPKNLFSFLQKPKV